MLGSKCGSNLSRLERRRRLPTLKTALALEIIFGVPVGELYAGIREEVERSVALRAEKLAEELEQSPEDELIDYQLEILNRITRVLR